MRKLGKPAGAAPAIQVKPGARKAIRRIFWSIFLIAVIFCGVISYLVFMGDLCEIRSVTVSGNKNLSSEYLQEVSGAKAYTNLATLPVGELESNLLEEAWVASAQISRHFPHSLTIRIREREPVAMIEYGTTGFIVDETGFVITGITTDEYPTLVRIHGKESQPPEVGKKPADPSLAAGLSIVSALPESVRSTLTLMNPFDPDGIICATNLGYNILFGDGANLEKKKNVLLAIVKDVEENHRSISYIDVSVPDSPVIKPK